MNSGKSLLIHTHHPTWDDLVAQRDVGMMSSTYTTTADSHCLRTIVRTGVWSFLNSDPSPVAAGRTKRSHGTSSTFRYVREAVPV